MSLAADVVSALLAADATIATAESLTGGRLCASLVDVPGASDVVAGGVVAYSAAAKTSVLGIDATLVDARGTVDAEVAAAMARSARERFASTYAVSTTGVAGPGAYEGHPQGTVFMALASPDKTDVCALRLDGDREAVRAETVARALSWVLDRVREENRQADRFH